MPYWSLSNKKKRSDDKFIGGFAGTKPGSSDCTLGRDDASQQRFMKIETETWSSLKSCLPRQQNPGDQDELHIVNIPESVPIR